MISNSLKQALDEFLNGDYARNRARLILATKGVSTDEMMQAKTYVEQLPETTPQRDLIEVLNNCIEYDKVQEVMRVLGIKGGEEGTIGFSEDEFKRMASVKTNEDDGSKGAMTVIAGYIDHSDKPAA